MAEKYSGVTIVIFITCGVLTFILLFLFAKRQITRFALKSRRGPHVPVGHDAPQCLRREIDRRLDRVTDVKMEPLLLQKRCELPANHALLKHGLNMHSCRVQAVDAVTAFLHELHLSSLRRPNENLQAFLINSLRTSHSKLIHHLCDAYEHARYDPSEFSTKELDHLMELLAVVRQCIGDTSLHRSSRVNPKSSGEPRPICSQEAVINGLPAGLAYVKNNVPLNGMDEEITNKSKQNEEEDAFETTV